MAATRERVEGAAQAWFDSRVARAATAFFLLAATTVAIPVCTWGIAKLIEIDRKLAVIEQTRQADRAAADQARQADRTAVADARQADLDAVRARFTAAELRMAEDRAAAAKAIEVSQQIVRDNAAMRATLDAVARDVSRLVARDDARTANRPGQ